jgi:hypothetical protein
MADVAMIDGGYGGEHERLANDPGTALGHAERSVLAALVATTDPVAPADLIRELECAGFRNPEIRSAIWHLLDRHRVRLTRDLRLVLPVTPAPPAPTPGS